LTVSKFNQVTIRISHHRKVTYHAANIHGRLNQNILLPRFLSDAIDFFGAVTLKAEVIETGFDFILNDYQDEDRIFSGSRRWTEPDIVPPFEASITHNGKSAEGNVKVD